MLSAERHQTLVELLRSKSLRHPERLAYTFLLDGESEEQKLTYGELDRQARAIAARLQELELEGRRVLLLYAPGLDYIAAFLGCLYAGVIAIPAYPPRNNRSLLRLQLIQADAQGAAILTTVPIMSRAEQLFDKVPALKVLPWIMTDTVESHRAETWMPPEIDGSSLAFLQYTSGSTATPKGVMVSHGNLLHNEQSIQEIFQQTEDSLIVGWLPFYHDMGLIGNVLQPLYVGSSCVLMSPVAFLQRPFRWLQAISKYQGTTSGGPNFAYELCHNRVTAEERASLNLSSWRVAFNGAEPIRSETLERFAATFAECGFKRESFYPCYGLAEATLIVSGKMRRGMPSVKAFQTDALENNRALECDAEQVNSRSLVGCGGSSHNQRIIVDPQTLTESLAGQVGEIWVKGESVTRGYWNRLEETEHTFHAHLSDTGAGPFLRTGDLGFVHDDELFITGRVKDLIIIRGQNHYPQDIELTVERCHPALRPGGGAAFSVEMDDEERLVVVQEIDHRHKADLHEVISLIRQAVSDEHELHAHAVVLIKHGTIHKTSSGKIQRQSCRAAFLNGNLKTLSEWRSSAHSAASEPAAGHAFASGADDSTATPLNAKGIEGWLRAEVAMKLGLDGESLDVNQPVTRFGLDSLMAVELSYAVERRLGVALPMTSFLQDQSLAQLSLHTAGLLAKDSSPGASSPPALAASAATGERPAVEHPLSRGQQALWYLHRLAPESAAYNIAAAVRITSALDAVKLRRAFQLLVDRHASLRTTFPEIDGQPVRRIHEHATVPFVEQDATGWDERVLGERLTEEAHAPFDLRDGPLLRVVLFRRAPGDHIMMSLTLHHIVADFWSLAVLMHELAETYAAETSAAPLSLPPSRASYDDFVRRQEQLLRGREGERLWSYWQQQLSGELSPLNLHTRQPRPAVQTFRGASHAFTIDTTLSERLRALGHGEGATLFMTLLAAFHTLLQRYTGQTDIIVGSPTAGRTSADVSGVVGYFVNPVALRVQVHGDSSFRQLLAQVRETTLAAFEHQEFPFAQLVEQLQPQRDASRSPIFQVMLVLQKSQLLREEGLAAFALGEAGARMHLGALRLESVPLEQRIAQFDLTLMLAEVEGALRATLEYNSDLFEAHAIRRMAVHFQTLLAGIVAEPQRRISELPLMTAAEQQELLVEFNRVKPVHLSGRDSLHELFEAQVKRTPGAVAVVGREGSLTYTELNRRANQLARHLRGMGVGVESLSGILLERTPEMLVGLLGVLKAGGAYVPLDAGYPTQRLRLMVADAGARLVLTQRSLLNVFEELITEAGQGVAAICLDEDWPRIELQDGDDLAHEVDEQNLAYVIYTSGSTGVPKGVAITHANAAVLVRWASAEFTREELSCVLAATSINFDLSIFEMFVPLATGGKLVLAANILEMLEPTAGQEVTLINTVPAAMAELVRAGGVPASVRVVITAGEPLTAHLAQQIYRQFPQVKRVVNLYGPSEDTTYSTGGDVPRGEAGDPTIGRPIANTQVYILNERLRPVPVGVTGELYISGDGLARGYLNRADITAARFMPNPFGDRGGARMYRTGDLARYLPGGEIEFVARADHQVKIRGFRVEPGEIAAALDEYAGVRESVVVARQEVGGAKRLVAYVSGDGAQGGLTAKHLRAYLKERLPDYMIPSAFVLLDELPRTPNGKIDRRSLPETELTQEAQAEDYSAPRTSFEEGIADIWTELLRVSRIGHDDNFFDLGGHSLLATQAISRIRDLFKVEIPLRKFIETPTVRSLALEVEAGLRNGAEISLPPICPALRDHDLPLSFGQQRLWLLQQLQPHSSFYNLGITLNLRGRLNTTALGQSLDEIVRRQEALRTTFPMRAGQPIQHISPAAPAANLRVIDLKGTHEDARQVEQMALALAQEEARQPFDLSTGPLWRASLVRIDDDQHLLLLCLHHIISDGWSSSILVRELAALYEAFNAAQPSPLPALTVQYGDYTLWQHQHLTGEILAAQLDYWREQLAGAPAALELPTDRVRPAVQSYRGAMVGFGVERALSEGLEALSRREGVTLFMTLLAAFNVLLHRYSHQEDVVVGTPIAGRNRSEIEPLIGFFVNTLALRTRMDGNPGLVELLERVKEVTLGAYAHQEMPFERLVEELRPAREMSHAPLFQVMLVLQKGAHERVRLGDVDAQVRGVEVGAAKFDLTLMLEEPEEGALAGWLEYNTDLFDAATIERLAGHFTRLLEALVADPRQRISALSLLSEAERRELLVEFNENTRVEGEARCINELFEAQVERTPEAVALIAGEQSLTYAELNRRADSLARYLQSKGVGAESLVGVLMRRTPEILVSLLGILKAGGAYVPLDAGYPLERLRLMVTDADVRIVLTQQDLSEIVRGFRGDSIEGREAVCLDRDWPLIARHDGAKPERVATPDNTAYVMYTSGSTGTPKGVIIQHTSACAFLRWGAYTFSAEQLSATLASTSINFDLSVFELFLPLCLGSTVILADSALQLPELPAAGLVTLINTVPSAIAELVRIGGIPPGVRTVNLCGEALHYSLVERIYEQAHVTEVYNLYGPTEDTVYSTVALMKRGGTGPSPIGRPIANTQTYVLDEDGEPVPRGVWGELYLSGEGLARGYLNRPGQTAERFVPEGLSGRAGARMYRTGDVVRYGRGGELEFQGRRDYQVKVRGFRIELGEIETVLGEQPGVREKVVVVGRDGEGNQRLVAYVVRDGEASGESAGDGAEWKSELRRKLKERLPEYMVPGVIMQMEALPRTENGKVDRRRLPEVGELGREVATEYEEAGTEKERVIAGVWREVLGIAAVGINDNFFDLGGHSLLLAQAHGKLCERLNRQFPLLDMFKYPTVSTLAGYLERADGEPLAPRQDKELIENLNKGQSRREKLYKRRRAM
jgi:amino acid adenylation domain-containing protein